MVRIWVAMLMMTAVTTMAAPANWSNADWAYRAQVSACSLEQRENAMVEWDVDFADLLNRAGAQGAFDPNSPRVMLLQDGQEKEVPCRFFAEKDSPAKGTLCWLRMGTMPANALESYSVYFDAGAAKAAKAYPELARAKPALAKNLAVNGALILADKADPAKPAGWTYFLSDADKTRGEWVKEGTADPYFKLTDTVAEGSMACAIQPGVAVEPLKRYAASCWVKAGKETTNGFVILTNWFSGSEGQPVASPDGNYGNYKMQGALTITPNAETPWTYKAFTAINFYDPKSKDNGPTPEQKTLPGTAQVRLEVGAIYGTAVACFSDIAFREMPDGTPIGLRVTEVQKKP